MPKIPEPSQKTNYKKEKKTTASFADKELISTACL